jgi:hypothetical protein
MGKVEKITRIPITEAFRYEAKHFTPWLQDNIEVVGDAIGIELMNAEREQSTENFSVDIKAEAANGEIVVIENQYGASDHKHLGQLVTYLSSFEAKIAIWVVENPKQEHINAINWLNEGENNCDFYLLRVEAIKIGDSLPAPLLSLIVGPSEESKQIGKKRQEETQNDKLRKQYWDDLFEKSLELKINQFANINTSGKDPWAAVTAGIRGLTYQYWVNQKNTRVELRIDRGKGSDAENLEIFNNLKRNEVEIETSFGGKLNWAELEKHRVCSIRFDISNGGYKASEGNWDASIFKTAEAMKNLMKSTKPFIKSLKLQ